MKTVAALLVAVVLIGCEVFRPPVIRNVSRDLVRITLVYSDQSSFSTDMVIGQILRHRGRKSLAEIAVSQSGRRTVYDRQALQSVTTFAGSPDDGVILITDTGLEIISLGEAEKRRMIGG